MSSNSKRKRVALVGKATKKKRVTDPDDVVTEILKSMDAEHQKFSNQNMLAYQSMLEQKRADGNQAKCLVTAEDVSNQRHSKMSKKIITEKKHPLMAKCQKNLKYLKHNRSIPKLRAHVGTLQLSPKEPIVKKQDSKKLDEASSTKRKAKNGSYTGNIWMINELNKKLLQSDCSDTEDITQEEVQSPVSEDITNASDNDSDFESFIQSLKEPVEDHNNFTNNSSKKRIKTKSSKSKRTKLISSTSNPAKLISKNIKTISKSKDTFTIASPENSIIEDSRNRKRKSSDSILQSVESELPDFLAERKPSSSKQKNMSPSSESCGLILGEEQSVFNISDCSVKLVRNPTLDNIVLLSDAEPPEITCEQNDLSLKSNDYLLSSDASPKSALERELDSDDDCIIIEVVPKSNNNPGSANKSQTSDGLLIENKYLEASETPETVKEMDIQILSVTSLKGSGDEHLDEIIITEVQNGTNHKDLNCYKTVEREKTSKSYSLNHETGVCSNKSATENSCTVIRGYQLPEQPLQVNIDELINKLDVESIKKVITFPSESLNNLTSSSRNGGCISDISSDTKSNVINVVSNNISIGSTPAQLNDFSNRACVLPKNVFLENSNESSMNSHATQNILEKLNKEELKKILSVSNFNNIEIGREQFDCHVKPPSLHTQSTIEYETQQSDRFVLNKNISTLAVSSKSNDAFWNNIKRAISSDTISNINSSLSQSKSGLPTHLSNNCFIPPNTSTTVCGTNYPFPNDDSSKIYDTSQFSKPTVLRHQLNKTVNEGQNSADQSYVASPSEELDVSAASSIQELCHQPEPCNIFPLFKLYNRESNILNTLRSAGQNVSVGLKMLEKDQAKKVRLIERAIENYCRLDPCFYKVMKEDNSVKSEVTLKNEGITYAVEKKPELDETRCQSPISSKQPKVLCQECKKTAKIKCLGCSEVFYCSEKCGMINWENVHHLECKKISS